MVEAPDGSTATITTDIKASGTYTPKSNGIYTVRYSFTYYKRSAIGETGPYTQNVTFKILAVSNYAPKPLWNIRTVIERILRVYTTKTLYDTEGKTYKLNAEQAAKFEKIPAPEFAITNKTLKEALDIVGSYIHGVPKLRDDTPEFTEIYFDMLGGTERAILSDPKYPYITRLFATDIENYATELDTKVENLVNSIDPNEGSVTEPFVGGVRSTRSEERYARITESNMVISTDNPIQSIQSVRCYVNGKSVDITPYVFEAAEYGRMSSYDGVYPSSKAFAIYYEKGQKNIKGLQYKSPTVYGGATSNYAITNILKAAADIDISAKAWEDGEYGNLKFTVQYTPIFSARIKVRKSYIDPKAPKSTLYYNQSDNIVETRFYGENLKGAIARMGNVEEIRTYLLKSFDYIPKAGQLWGDDMYVSSVSCALYGTYIECTVALTKDYNRKSGYIGINSQWRAYEVSEKTAYERDMVYTDYAVIGAKSGGPNTLTTSRTGTVIRHAFQKYYTSAPITAAVVKSIDENGNIFAKNTVPVVSTAFGDVMSFRFGMADNYSAGERSDKRELSSVTGYWQTDSPYCDYYGEMFAMGLELGRTGNMDLNGDGAYDVPSGDFLSNSIFQTDDNNPLRIEKNGGEILSLNYELQFVTTIPQLVIGSALARRCPLVGSTNANAAGLYIMPKRVGKFETAIDLTQATKLEWSVDGKGNGQGDVSFDSATATVNGEAWAIADEGTGELLLAMNKPVTSGQTVEIPPISFINNV